MTNDRIVVDSVKDHLCWRAALISSISLQTCCRQNQLPEKTCMEISHQKEPVGTFACICVFLNTIKHTMHTSKPSVFAEIRMYAYIKCVIV